MALFARVFARAFERVGRWQRRWRLRRAPAPRRRGGPRFFPSSRPGIGRAWSSVAAPRWGVRRGVGVLPAVSLSLRAQTFAAAAATAQENFPAGFGCRPSTKAVAAFAHQLAGLIRTFHGTLFLSSFNLGTPSVVNFAAQGGSVIKLKPRGLRYARRLVKNFRACVRCFLCRALRGAAKFTCAAVSKADMCQLARIESVNVDLGGLPAGHAAVFV